MPTDSDNKNKEVVIKAITNKIRNSVVGYAGFIKKRDLRELVNKQIFDNNTNISSLKKVALNDEEIKDDIKKTITACKDILPSQTTRIFIFPSYSAFTKKHMGGTSGYTPWKNTILIFINTLSDSKRTLSKTITHEYTHSVSRKYHLPEDVGDWIVFEGLAENFTQQVLSGKLSPWSTSLSLHSAKQEFYKMKPFLSYKDWETYNEVFFKNDKFPLWAGYVVGYQLVRLYIEKYPDLSWSELVKVDPKIILRNSPFVTK